MKTFDPGSWTGDLDELAPVEQLLLADPNLCERTFTSKHVAFLAGRYLGEVERDPRDWEEDSVAVSTADLEKSRRVLEEVVQETVGESIAGLVCEGLIRWSREWRHGRPVFVATKKGMMLFEFMAPPPSVVDVGEIGDVEVDGVKAGDDVSSEQLMIPTELGDEPAA